ncbi:MAG: hypothetical protein AAGF56_13465 [Pseudomonadota bacterium]
MKWLAVFLALGAAPSAAETIRCDLLGTPVSFTIDRTQFGPAHNAGEPTQRRVTSVQMGDATFPAEPLIIGDTRGFWAEGLGGTEVMLIMQADGNAVYVKPRAGERLVGRCEAGE